MAKTQYHCPHGGHPWDSRPGFDLLEVVCDTKEELDLHVQEAKKRFWSPWMIGVSLETGKPAAVYYKPSGFHEPWEDSVEHPHPGGEVQIDPNHSNMYA